MAKPAKTGAPKKGVKYTFSGQYYASVGTDKKIKSYELDVVFAESHPGALSIFRKSLHDTTSNIYKLMLKKYPDYVRFRTHSITAEVNLTDPTKAPKAIDRMNKNQLAKYIKDNDVEIDVTIFGDDIAAIRKAISDYEENPELFAEKYEELKKEYETKRTLDDLNPVDEDDTGADSDAPNADDLLDDLDGSEDDEIELEDVNE